MPFLLKTLHTHLYAATSDVRPGPLKEVEGVSLPTLLCPSISQSQFGLSFEELAIGLQHLERLCFEYDGSFVWAGVERASESKGIAHDTSWQLYGMLYDYAGRVQRVELMGACTLDTWRQLLGVLRRSESGVIAHQIEAQCFLDADCLEAIWH